MYVYRFFNFLALPCLLEWNYQSTDTVESASVYYGPIISILIIKVCLCSLYLDHQGVPLVTVS